MRCSKRFAGFELQTFQGSCFACRYFEDSNLYAKRWQRREPQTLTVLKKAVLDASTTEVARRLQFQAFDLDGNGTISKSEIDMMLSLIRGAEPSVEEVDEIMANADPAQSSGKQLKVQHTLRHASDFTSLLLHSINIRAQCPRTLFTVTHFFCLLAMTGRATSQTCNAFLMARF